MKTTKEKKKCILFNSNREKKILLLTWKILVLSIKVILLYKKNKKNIYNKIYSLQKDYIF